MKALDKVKWGAFVFGLRLVFTLLLCVLPMLRVPFLANLFETHWVLYVVLVVATFTVAVTAAQYVIEAVRKSPKLRRPFEKN